MQRLIVLIVLAAVPAIAFDGASAGEREHYEGYQPQQIHISIGKTSNDIVVTWTTWDETPSVVQFGTDGLQESAEGAASSFTDGGDEQRTLWVHRVTLQNLAPDTRYFYHCGSDLGWSSLYTFKTWKEGNEWPISVAVYGDMGSINAQSIPRLQDEVQRGMYDAVIHAGDFAYNMDTDNARVGDDFMRMIEPIAAYVPYLTCPGNHEENYNFSNYRARFSMPNYEVTESYFYSFNMGPVHFIAVNTEAYYYVNYGFGPLERQYEWLVKDLEEANTPEARAERPWIVLYGHRPMYCSNSDHDDCTRKTCLTRVGLPLIHSFAMEELLYDYGVDLAIWAHEHSYERLWPLYDYVVMNGSTEEPYTNPRAPVHIITGSAGCESAHNPFLPEQPEWSAFRAVDYGYTRLNVYNKTHMYWEQVSDDKDGEIIDSVWLIRDRHVSYADLQQSQEEE